MCGGSSYPLTHFAATPKDLDYMQVIDKLLASLVRTVQLVVPVLHPDQPLQQHLQKSLTFNGIYGTWKKALTMNEQRMEDISKLF